MEKHAGRRGLGQLLADAGGRRSGEDLDVVEVVVEHDLRTPREADHVAGQRDAGDDALARIAKAIRGRQLHFLAKRRYDHLTERFLPLGRIGEEVRAATVSLAQRVRPGLSDERIANVLIEESARPVAPELDAGVAATEEARRP